MKDTIQSWKRLWKDLGTRRWIFLLLVGILLVVVAIPVEKNGTKDDTQGSMLGSSDGSTGKGSGSVGNHSAGSYSSDGAISGTEVIGTGVTSTVSAYEMELEVRLVQLLRQIDGAGEVEVMVTVSRSSERILQSDTSREESVVQETDAQGGIRNNTSLREESQTVLVGGSGTAQPYVVGEIMPQVEGVVVACEGGDRPSIQAEISAAVQALFDLQPHKIKVCKMASP